MRRPSYKDEHANQLDAEGPEAADLKKDLLKTLGRRAAKVTHQHN